MGALFEKPAFLVLILLVLLLFGAKRLPDLARGVGRSLRIFKAETEGLQGDGQAGRTAQPPSAGPALVAPAVAPAGAPDAPRSLADPVTRERILAVPVTPPLDGRPLS